MKAAKMIVLSAAVILFVCGSVMAAPFNLNRPYINFGTSAEPTLQDIFDDVITNGALDAVTDQSNAALWQMSNDGDVDAYLVSMFRGDNGTLGIYSASTGAMYDFSFGTANQASFMINNAGSLWFGNTEIDSRFGTTFGFYWKNTSTPLYSFTEDDKNTEGKALALSYRLDVGMKIDTLAFGGKTLTATGDDWILAFEDRLYGDFDFNDAVFLVEDIVPTPEPATIVLLGVGLMGLAGLTRRKKAA